MDADFQRQDLCRFWSQRRDLFRREFRILAPRRAGWGAEVDAHRRQSRGFQQRIDVQQFFGLRVEGAGNVDAFIGIGAVHRKLQLQSSLQRLPRFFSEDIDAFVAVGSDTGA